LESVSTQCPPIRCGFLPTVSTSLQSPSKRYEGKKTDGRPSGGEEERHPIGVSKGLPGSR
jgi:hypothetical protein